MKTGPSCHTLQGVVRFPLPQPEGWGMCTVTPGPRTSVRGGVFPEPRTEVRGMGFPL